MALVHTVLTSCAVCGLLNVIDASVFLLKQSAFSRANNCKYPELEVNRLRYIFLRC